MSSPESSQTELCCSIIVPVYNGALVIERCLNALAMQSVSPESYEVIVVNDGSHDLTAERVRAWSQNHPEFQLQMIEQENAGPAAARNYGASIARGKILVFTDADCRPIPTWLASIQCPFDDDQRVVAVMGAYLSEQSPAAARFAQLEFEERYVLMSSHEKLDLIATYSAAFDRQVFLNAGGFDPTFPEANNEDVEFSYRLSEQGYRMVFAPDAQVLHEHDTGWMQYARTKFSRAYWRTVVLLRHPAKAIKDSYTPQTLKLQILLAPLVPLGCLLAVVEDSLAWLWLAVPFLLTTTPLTFFALRRKPSVAIWAPWGLWVRSMVFALGVAWALAHRIFSLSLPESKENENLRRV
ncbi:MAG: glycosyltransferase [Caldilineaceae bacterium]|nr:glycosyltransferase [Caldilineaceae bacterium]